MSAAERMLYPARVVGHNVAHLADTVAGDDELEPPRLVAVCPAGATMTGELELIPETEAHRIVWCPSCRDYLEALARITPIPGLARPWDRRKVQWPDSSENP